ncbi:SDR family NAD(P)-dependent oxidoreductase [Actinospica robiniae]|uniref:SDR family NAD(P)-dependent oxidoreductase n=1 Tax=Actinospica robiniae TaxID=304901 RepID=UPI00040E23CB|nr:SDR family NAD(P)-dependent oxidoreductase [Actinospica robiniae]
MSGSLLTDYVLGRAAEYGDKPAVVDAATGEAITFGRIPARIEEIAQVLRHQGLRPGMAAAVRMPNGPQLPLVQHAILSLGAVAVSLNALTTEPETGSAMVQTGAGLLICEPPGAIEAAVCGPAPSRSSDGADGADGDAPAMVFMSSGTTGTPKPVSLPHRSLIGALARLEAVHRVEADDVVFCAVALSHVYGVQSALHPALRAGASVLTLARFDLDLMIDAIVRHRATLLYLVPTILRRLADHPRHRELAGLRAIVSAGSPLGADLAEHAATRLGVRIVENYGMTEAGGATHTVPDDARPEPGSIGLPLPGIRCRLVDHATGREADPGEPGELWMSSPDFVQEGWLPTGDVVERAVDGGYRIVGRIKELIKCNGNQVAPGELEAVLAQHPDVIDAAVVGVPDERYGEVPKAFVVASGADGAELLAYVAERVAPYKKVRAIEFVAALPRNSGGKVLRHRLATRNGAPVTVVTGGSRGFGRAAAEELVRRGHRVVLTARGSDRLARAEEELRALGGDVLSVPADLAEPGAFEAVLCRTEAEFGPVGTLVNNAGVQGPVGELWKIDPDQWWAAITVNLRSAALACSAVLPVMTQRRQGRIVNIVSHAGVAQWPHLSAYSVSKAALIKLTENLAAETRRYGVAVFSFHPGLLEIGLGETQLATEAAPGSWSAKVSDWLRQEQAAGHLTPVPDAVAALARLIEQSDSQRTGSYLTTADFPAASRRATIGMTTAPAIR